jgi:hypothetical protein
MDSAYEQACELESALEASIATEDYTGAAQHMREYKALRAQDPVLGVLKVLFLALIFDPRARPACMRICMHSCVHACASQACMLVLLMRVKSLHDAGRVRSVQSHHAPGSGSYAEEESQARA